MKIGQEATATFSFTLAGAPATVEAVTEVTLTPPESGTVTTFDASGAKITWNNNGTGYTGVTVSAKADNVAGAVVGDLVIVSAPFDVAAADVLTADAGTVTVA